MKNLLPLLLLLLAACKKDPGPATNLCAPPQYNTNNCITDTAQLKALLNGRWNWTQGVAGWTLAETNPCTEGINYAYLINGNLVQYYRNDSLLGTGTYYFTNNYGAKIVITDTAQAFYSSGWVSICGNYLIIDETPVDGNKEVFLKEN